MSHSHKSPFTDTEQQQQQQEEEASASNPSFLIAEAATARNNGLSATTPKSGTV